MELTATMHEFSPYCPARFAESEMRARAKEFYEFMSLRRTVRHFDDKPVERELIETAIATASTAPSGAHRQPWTFAVVGRADLKRRIREAAEAEEWNSYEGGRMPEDWLEAVAPMGTNWKKPYLETAPWIVVLFEQTYGLTDDVNERQKNYYVRESVGIACGLFITAIHQLGLCTLTHTPSPMAFLAELLERPPNERAFVLLPIGYAADDAVVPNLPRKPLDQVSVWFD